MFQNLRSNKRMFVLLAVLVGLIVPLRVMAANTYFTGLSDSMSSLKANTASDHDILFTTPSAINSSGDTIAITFPAGFSATGVDYTDIDLSHGVTTGDETSETLAAVPGAGAWGAAFSSLTLTLTSPTDASGSEISANEKIRLKIGHNASGAEANAQLTNPGSGTKIITILLSNGSDSATGSIGVVIIDDNQVVVGLLIDPYITFTVSNNNVTLQKSGGGNADYQNTGYNSDNTLAVATNSTGGYKIRYMGPTLTDPSSNTITALSTGGASTTNTEQFGLNLVDNTTPNTGAAASGGIGAAATGYDTADTFKFVPSTSTFYELANSNGASDTTTYTVSYMANVGATTEAGNYSTTITYVATGIY